MSVITIGSSAVPEGRKADHVSPGGTRPGHHGRSGQQQHHVVADDHLAGDHRATVPIGREGSRLVSPRTSTTIPGTLFFPRDRPRGRGSAGYPGSFSTMWQPGPSSAHPRAPPACQAGRGRRRPSPATRSDIKIVASRFMTCLLTSAPAITAIAAGAAAAIVRPAAIPIARPGDRGGQRRRHRMAMVAPEPIMATAGAIPRHPGDAAAARGPAPAGSAKVPTGATEEQARRPVRRNAPPGRREHDRGAGTAPAAGRAPRTVRAQGSKAGAETVLQWTRPRSSPPTLRATPAAALGSRRAARATRRATPYSQLATESPLRIPLARRARTRNVAWQASSASCRSTRMASHTFSTIGPWRLHQRPVNEASASASPLPRRNRSRSWPSLRPQSVPAPKRVRNDADRRLASSPRCVVADLGIGVLRNARSRGEWCVASPRFLPARRASEGLRRGPSLARRAGIGADAHVVCSPFVKRSKSVQARESEAGDRRQEPAPTKAGFRRLPAGSRPLPAIFAFPFTWNHLATGHSP